MNSLNYSPPAKEEDVCWTEKQGLWLNIVVKEEEEEKDVTVKGDEEASRVKAEDQGEITVTTKEEDEEEEYETGDLINTTERPDSAEEPEPETSEPARRHHCSYCGKSFNQRRSRPAIHLRLKRKKKVVPQTGLQEHTDHL
ncbi:zinc finger protein 771-like isoform X3 [Oncorhynchus kisutch]|uniref:zinc finger protein 771-like isoform X3 n=1 Tax=Oncorhynchus kisutch TaxID=8019 RepID=UPI0012DE8EF1|nr:zinc finger protein 771-like isoform X3 [Oncorhynchus kisutch]